MSQLSGTSVRQSLLLLLTGAIGGILFWQLRFIIPALLGAYALYVLLRRPLFYLTEIRHWPVRPAVAVLLLVSTILLLLPLQWLFSVLQNRIVVLLQNSDLLLHNAQHIINRIETQ